jgi:lipopolysaccharide export system protein LptA
MGQGTTHIVADKVTAYKNMQGDIDQVVAIGNPAHYSTLPDDQKYPIDAFGDRIVYYPIARIAQIIGNGYVTQGKNSLKGPHIIYEMDKKIVRSLPLAARNGEKSSLVLQPQDFPGKKRVN